MTIAMVCGCGAGNELKGRQKDKAEMSLRMLVENDFADSSNAVSQHFRRTRFPLEGICGHRGLRVRL
jgi:hypothetical protein